MRNKRILLVLLIAVTAGVAVAGKIFDAELKELSVAGEHVGVAPGGGYLHGLLPL